MSPDDIQSRFVDEIKLRAYDDRYIDKNEEREILQIAIQHGIGIDAARESLAEVCAREGYVLESTLFRLIKDQAVAAAGPAGKVDQKTFDEIVQSAKAAAQGRRGERDLKKMVVTVMEDIGLDRSRSGWFGDWYASLKRDLGLGS
jgi:hypothetical protein